MSMPWEGFCFVFTFVQQEAALSLQWPLAQQFMAIWAGGM
jgi:hypothetical protein